MDSSVAHQDVGYLTSQNSADALRGALDTVSTVRCDRPRPTSQLELQQYSSQNALPPAAQNHNMKWRARTSKGVSATQGGSPSSAAHSMRSPQHRGSSPAHRESGERGRVVSGDLEGSESVWSSECPDKGNRMLHISGRPDDKASGWPYNTRRW